MKNKIIVFTFLGYIFIFSIFHLILKDEEISVVERRKLKTFPSVEITNKYISNLEEYLLDHFPLRDNFRSLKSTFNFNILRKLDNNGVYKNGNYISKMDYKVNEESISNFIDKTLNLEKMFTNVNNVYMMIVPDKNYYIKDCHLQLDFDYIYEKLNELDYKMIDIRNILNLSDYYYTDTHWKQENLSQVVKKAIETMGLNYEEITYIPKTYDDFYGVYSGDLGIKVEPEKITVLTNDTLNSVDITYLENTNLKSVYNFKKIDGYDAYEVYLDGATSFIEIKNNKNTKGNELIVFRDSFGSSFIPLLIPFYSKITVIDNRYIMSEYINDYLEFNNQDILFLYSTLIINNSGSLKG